MHVCICTCTDVFVTMLEWNIKSRLVALCSAPASSSHSAREAGVNAPSVSHYITTKQSSTSSVVIFKKRRAPPPPHCPPIIIIIIFILVLVFLKSLISFPCVSKADWLIKSGRGGTSSGFGILHWLVFLQSLLLCWIY